MKDDIARIEAALGGKLPDRYRTFLTEAEYRDLPILHLREGYLKGCFQVTFDDPDYLCDVGAIGDDYGIDDMGDVDWKRDFAGYAPFAVLDVLDEDGEIDVDASAELGAFLLVKVDQPECPVYLFEKEGWMLYPLAASLDDFAAGNAWAGDEPEIHDNLGLRFESFAWIDEVPEELGVGEDEEEDYEDDDDDD